MNDQAQSEIILNCDLSDLGEVKKLNDGKFYQFTELVIFGNRIENDRWLFTTIKMLTSIDTDFAKKAESKNQQTEKLEEALRQLGDLWKVGLVKRIHPDFKQILWAKFQEAKSNSNEYIQEMMRDAEPSWRRHLNVKR
jgi:hypothetical protein